MTCVLCDVRYLSRNNETEGGQTEAGNVLVLMYLPIFSLPNTSHCRLLRCFPDGFCPYDGRHLDGIIAWKHILTDCKFVSLVGIFDYVHLVFANHAVFRDAFLLLMGFDFTH